MDGRRARLRSGGKNGKNVGEKALGHGWLSIASLEA
jgi:hypothetical protein